MKFYRDLFEARLKMCIRDRLTLSGLIWGGIQVARGQVDDPSGYVINIFWGAVNIAAMLPLIFAAMWTPPEEQEASR